MSIEAVPQFQFSGYNIPTTVIRMNNLKQGEQLSIHLQPNGRVEMNLFTLSLDLFLYYQKSDTMIVEDIDGLEQYAMVHIHAIGKFYFPDKQFITQNDHFLFLNAPAVLMPYVRAHLSACTAMAGYPPLNLPLFNMASFAEKLKENTVFEI